MENAELNFPIRIIFLSYRNRQLSTIITFYVFFSLSQIFFSLSYLPKFLHTIDFIYFFYENGKRQWNRRKMKKRKIFSYISLYIYLHHPWYQIITLVNAHIFQLCTSNSLTHAHTHIHISCIIWIFFMRHLCFWHFL